MVQIQLEFISARDYDEYGQPIESRGDFVKKIRLELENILPTTTDIVIIDMADDGKERRRGAFTAEYTRVDVKPLAEQGLGLEEAVQRYDEWLHKCLRRYLLAECEIVEGHHEFLNVIRENIRQYFQK